QASEAQSREQTCQSQVAEAGTRLEGLRQQREQAQVELGDSKVAVATQEQVHAACLQQQRSLNQRAQELNQLIEQRRGEIPGLAARKQQAESEIQDSQLQIEKLQRRREQVNAQAAELQGQQQAQQADIAAREDSLREQRRSLEQFQQQRSALEV